MAVSPRSALAHYAQRQALRAQNRFEEAASEYEAAITFDRNWMFAYFGLGECKFRIGSIEEVIALAQKAIRISRRDAYIGYFYNAIAFVDLLQSRTDEAIGLGGMGPQRQSRAPLPSCYPRLSLCPER